MIRAVFDTVVFVRSLLSPFGWWGTLVFDNADRYQLILSEPVIREVVEVLRRPELSRKYRTVATRNVETILALLASAEVVPLATIPPISRDPNDDKFLATAMAGRAQYLVSADRDLLDLGEYNGVTIVDGHTFLEILAAQHKN